MAAFSPQVERGENKNTRFYKSPPCQARGSVERSRVKKAQRGLRALAQAHDLPPSACAFRLFSAIFALNCSDCPRGTLSDFHSAPFNCLARKTI